MDIFAAAEPLLPSILYILTSFWTHNVRDARQQVFGGVTWANAVGISGDI